MGSQNKEYLHPAVYGCGLFILVNVGRLPELFPYLYDLKVGKISIALAITGVILSRYKTINKINNSPLSGLLLIFTLLVGITITFSIWKSHSLEFFQSSFLPVIIIFYLIIGTTKTIKEIQIYIYSLIVAAAILSYQTITLDWVGRLSVGTSYDPNDLALILVTILPLVIAAFITTKKITKIIMLTIIAVMVIAILLTASRGGFIGLLSVCIYLISTKFINYKGKSKKWLNKNLLIIPIIGIILWTLVPEQNQEQILSITNVESDYNLNDPAGRISIWGRGLEIFFENPYGVGIDTFHIAEGTISGRYQAPHNSLLQVAVEIGLAGLFIYLFIYKKSYKLLRQMINEKQIDNNINKSRNLYEIYSYALLGSLIGFFITSFFLSQAYAGVFYILLAIISSLSYLFINDYKIKLKSELLSSNNAK